MLNRVIYIYPSHVNDLGVAERYLLACSQITSGSKSCFFPPSFFPALVFLGCPAALSCLWAPSPSPPSTLLQSLIPDPSHPIRRHDDPIRRHDGPIQPSLGAIARMPE